MNGHWTIFLILFSFFTVTSCNPNISIVNEGNIVGSESSLSPDNPNTNNEFRFSSNLYFMSQNREVTLSIFNGQGPYTVNLEPNLGTVTQQSNQSLIYQSPNQSGQVKITLISSNQKTTGTTVYINHNLTLFPQTLNLLAGQNLELSISGGLPPYSSTISGGLLVGNTYQAPSTPGIYNIQVMDSHPAPANQINRIITVYPAISISPANLILNSNELLQLTANGGIGAKRFRIINGLGSLTQEGQFQAPAVGGTTLIEVTDAQLNSAQFTITTNGSFGIFPANTTISVNQSLTLIASGGTPPYQFQLQSGVGNIDPVTGVYVSAVAGSAVIRATDQMSQSFDATLIINPVLTLNLSSSFSAPNASVQASASGGSGSYQFSINSGSCQIHPTDGSIIAANSPGQCIFRVTDSSGSMATTTLQVSTGPIISANPTQQVINQTVQLSATQGSPPYIFSISSGGGSINSSSGLFTAPGTPGITIITVTDQNNLSNTYALHIKANLAITNTLTQVYPTETLAIQAEGGIPPYTYSITSGLGNLHATSGLFTAANSAGSTQIRVTDALGNYQESSITILDNLSLNQTNVDLLPGSTFNFLPSGGQAPYTWAILAGAGSIDSNGVFTSPAFPQIATIRVRDVNLKARQATITTRAALTINPGEYFITQNAQQILTPSGGLPPYTFSLINGPGSLGANGLFESNSTSGTSTIRISESLGSNLDIPIHTISTLAVTPSNFLARTNSVHSLVPTGGRPPYSFSILSGLGSVGLSSGQWVAPNTGGVTQVQVIDQLGQTTLSTITTSPQLSITNAATPEGTDVEVALQLSSTSSLPIQIQYTTSDQTALAGSDYTAQSSTVTFNAGETTKVLMIPTQLRNGYQGNRIFNISITSSDMILNQSPLVIAATINETENIIAQATGHPSGISSQINFNITVFGDGVNTYKYKYGTSSLTDCSQNTGYSSQQLMTQNISMNLSAVADGLIHLCLIGYTSDGLAQTTPTLISWTKYTSAYPVAQLTQTPSNPSSVSQLNILVSGVQVVQYSYKLGTAAQINCSQAVGYEPLRAINIPITNSLNSLDDGLLRLCVVAKDSLDNIQPYSAATVFEWSKLSTNPTATISSSSAYFLTNPNLTLQINWNRDVTGFTASDLQVSNGTVQSLTGGPRNFTAVISVPTQGIVTVSIPENICQDLSSNLNLGSNSIERLFDTIAPTSPANLSFGSIPNGTFSTPTLHWDSSSDSGSGVASYQVQIHLSSNHSIIRTWTALNSGQSLSGLALSLNTNYYFKVRSLDQAGNQSIEAQSNNWTTASTLQGTWQTITGTNAPSARTLTASAATSSHVVVFGGADTNSYSISGGRAYSFANNTWTTISTTNALVSRYQAIARVVNNRIRIFGGYFSNVSSGYPHIDGSDYDPNTNTWYPIQPGAIFERQYALSHVINDGLWIWGGLSDTDPALTSLGHNMTQTGGIYNFSTDLWEDLSKTGAPAARSNARSVKADNQIVIWGGENIATSTLLNSGGRFDLDTKTWATMTTSGAPSTRTDFTMTWNPHRSEVLVLGGFAPSTSTIQTTHRVYNPTTNLWSAFSPSGTFIQRYAHGALYKNNKIYVFGGETADGTTRDFAIYDSVSNSWEAGPSGPPEYSSHLNLAYGNQQFFATGGGYSSGYPIKNKVHLFNPSTYKWQNPHVTGAPVGRYQAHNYWTGNYFLIWGGVNDTDVPLNSGGLYNPTANTWTSMTTTGAPTAATNQAVTLTPTRFFVFGGINSSNVPLTTTRFFDLTNLTWSTPSTTNQPSARYFAGATSVGEDIYVWGGCDASSIPQNNGKSLINNSWINMVSTNAPTFSCAAVKGVTLNNKPYFCGLASGIQCKGYNLSPTEEWDTSYIDTANAPTYTSVFELKPINNQSVLVFQKNTNRLSILNVSAQTWFHSATAPTTIPGDASAAVDTDRQIVLLTGSNFNYIYNITQNTWSATPLDQSPTARTYPRLHDLGDYIAVIGGQAYPYPQQASTFGALYHVDTGTWTNLKSDNLPTNYIYNMKSEFDGTHINFYDYGIAERTIYRFNPFTQSWSSPISLQTSPRLGTSFHYVPDLHSLVVWGGSMTSDGSLLNLMSQTQSYIPPRIYLNQQSNNPHFAEQLGNYFVIIGGISQSTALRPMIQNLTTGKWYRGTMPPADILANNFNSFKLDNNRLILISPEPNRINAAIYSVTTNQWESFTLNGTPALNTTYGKIIGTNQTDQIMIWGLSSSYNQGIILNTQSKNWSLMSTSNAPTSMSTAHLTPNGVLFFGSATLSTPSLYLDSSQSWTTLNGTSGPGLRAPEFSTFINGSLFIWGGYNYSTATTMTNGFIFTP